MMPFIYSDGRVFIRSDYEFTEEPKSGETFGFLHNGKRYTARNPLPTRSIDLPDINRTTVTTQMAALLADIAEHLDDYAIKLHVQFDFLRRNTIGRLDAVDWRAFEKYTAE